MTVSHYVDVSVSTFGWRAVHSELFLFMTRVHVMMLNQFAVPFLPCHYCLAADDTCVVVLLLLEEGIPYQVSLSQASLFSMMGCEEFPIVEYLEAILALVFGSSCFVSNMMKGVWSAVCFQFVRLCVAFRDRF